MSTKRELTRKMINVAITGNFASGKSFALEAIKSMGYKTFSCDNYVKELYKRVDVQKIVEKSIPELEFFDRKKLAKIIYKDDNSRAILESIIHPKVRDGIKTFEESNKNEKLLFTEVPLLFETGFDKYFLYNICVFCSEETRVKRAKDRNIDSYKNFKKINEIQMKPMEKKKRADFSVNSEMELEKIKESLKDIIKKIEK